MASLAGATVLYVEDDDVNWTVAEVRLRGKISLVRAASDREAFSRLREARFTAVLMDIGLEGSRCNGIEVTRALRGVELPEMPEYARGVRLELDVPIIYVTGYCASYTREELLDTGASDVLYKPVDFVRLVFALNRAL